MATKLLNVEETGSRSVISLRCGAVSGTTTLDSLTFAFEHDRKPENGGRQLKLALTAQQLNSFSNPGYTSCEVCEETHSPKPACLYQYQKRLMVLVLFQLPFDSVLFFPSLIPSLLIVSATPSFPWTPSLFPRCLGQQGPLPSWQDWVGGWGGQWRRDKTKSVKSNW